MSGTTNTPERAELGLIGLNRATFLIALLILVPAVAFVAWMGFAPTFHERQCIESYIPSFEERLGFKFGQLPSQGREDLWALVEVTEGGPLSQAGFRSGDIPRGYRRASVWGLCAALKARDEGGDRTVEVVNIADWNHDKPKRERALEIPGK